MILDFSPRCKMLFTQISPDKRRHNLCKFLDILQTDPLYTAFPLYKRYPCGHKKKQHVLCTHAVGSGASDENRTRNLSLGSWCFATKLRSHLPFGDSDRRQCLYFRGAEKWSWKRDLNTRPVHYECTALPTELFQHRLYREISHAGLPIYYTTNSWFVKRFQKNSLKNQKNDWNRRKDVL